MSRDHVLDLNELQIETDGPSQPLRDYGTKSGSTEVIFKGLRERLIKLISEADIVLGCVAWLTCPRILGALAQKKGVSLIVQKEDFLRPEDDGDTASRLQPLYSKLKGLCRHHMPGLVGGLSVCSGIDLDPIRCVGNQNFDKKPAHPRSHHKFAIFCRQTEPNGPADSDEIPRIVPYAVWTGSFNFTPTATKSFENAVILLDPALVQAYYGEYGQVTALSEPLDWKSVWSVPEWRLGT